MALVLNDRVKETSTTTGTGTLNLAGASQDFIGFVAGIGTGNQTYYCIQNTGFDEFEVGIDICRAPAGALQISLVKLFLYNSTHKNNFTWYGCNKICSYT